MNTKPFPFFLFSSYEEGETSFTHSSLNDKWFEKHSVVEKRKYQHDH